MVREFRNFSIAKIQASSKPLSYEEYEAIAVLSAKYVAKHLEQ